MIGIDTEQIERFLNWDKKKLERIFLPKEIEYAKTHNFAQSLCSFWCVKEALVKALDETGLVFNKVEVTHAATNKPYVVINNYLKELLAKRGYTKIDISITNCAGLATAIVLLS